MTGGHARPVPVATPPLRNSRVPHGHPPHAEIAHPDISLARGARKVCAVCGFDKMRGIRKAILPQGFPIVRAMHTVRGG